VSLKLHGMKELKAKLDELGAKLAAKTLGQAMRKSFAPVLAAAQAMAPVDTGLLRESLSITLRRNRKSGSIQVGLRIGGGARAKLAAGAAAAFGERSFPAARRWHFVEFGTADMAAHPFLRPALDSQAARVLALLKSELTERIAKARKKR
jgi:HK97 gp10 family phage protein